jgi:hypothetical protein
MPLIVSAAGIKETVFFIRGRKGEREFVRSRVMIAEQRQRACVGHMCLAAQVANDVPEKSRPSGSSVGKNSMAQSQSSSSCQYGSESSLHFVAKIVSRLLDFLQELAV